jgi:peptidoglycan lytic transglycosylase G
MVGRFKEAARDVGLVAGADRQGVSPHDAVTVASIVQREARREQDLAGVAEVVYNRLDGFCRGSGRRLQMDSTVHYAAGDNDSVFTTEEMRAVDSPYNTYLVPGLPPGPIASPGEAALAAALDPADEGSCFFVTVDLDTGETLFADTAAEHKENVARLREFCEDSELC